MEGLMEGFMEGHTYHAGPGLGVRAPVSHHQRSIVVA